MLAKLLYHDRLFRRQADSTAQAVASCVLARTPARGPGPSEVEAAELTGDIDSLTDEIDLNPSLHRGDWHKLLIPQQQIGILSPDREAMQ